MGRDLRFGWFHGVPYMPGLAEWGMFCFYCQVGKSTGGIYKGNVFYLCSWECVWRLGGSPHLGAAAPSFQKESARPSMCRCLFCAAGMPGTSSALWPVVGSDSSDAPWIMDITWAFSRPIHQHLKPGPICGLDWNFCVEINLTAHGWWALLWVTSRDDLPRMGEDGDASH